MSMEIVSSLLQTPPVPQIWAVENGIGKTKNAFHAQRDGPSTQKISVFLLLINVLLVINLVSVHLATKDMISRMENVSTLCQMMPSLLTLDAVLGIGITKSVWHVLQDGSSTLKKDVWLFQINAEPILIMEIVLHATKDTILKKVNVCSLTPIMLNLPIWDAEPGIGTTKSA